MDVQIEFRETLVVSYHMFEMKQGLGSLWVQYILLIRAYLNESSFKYLFTTYLNDYSL